MPRKGAAAVEPSRAKPDPLLASFRARRATGPPWSTARSTWMDGKHTGVHALPEPARARESGTGAQGFYRSNASTVGPGGVIRPHRPTSAQRCHQHHNQRQLDSRG